MPRRSFSGETVVSIRVRLLRFLRSGQPQADGQRSAHAGTGLTVAGNFFQTLGVEPSLGRLFTAEECLHNSRPVVLLSHAFWKRQYAGDRGIVGQAIDLNGTPVTVIGVLPESFDFGSIFSPG